MDSTYQGSRLKFEGVHAIFVFSAQGFAPVDFTVRTAVSARGVLNRVARRRCEEQRKTQMIVILIVPCVGKLSGVSRRRSSDRKPRLTMVISLLAWKMGDLRMTPGSWRVRSGLRRILVMPIFDILKLL
jgi:hypothetical protein